MNAAAHSREDIILSLFGLFRRAGYEGVSLSDISEATGLGKSSLYHHFPGGKPDMAAAVIAFVRDWMNAHLFAMLEGKGAFAARVDAMLAATSEMYEGGKAPCIIASMMIARGGDPVSAEIGRLLGEWIKTLAAALRAQGASARDAEERATTAIIMIEGALIVARATGRAKIFQDALKQTRALLLV